ncbi:MAG TPA: hypothetical protein PLY68_09835 [Myxococcota bacterium]|nr:hypothetical protein [Myxococcota bacterium]HPB51132.1 hypothetical protein [Myxococcota bacterium]HQP96479.1 hypothetical protein [Myxococcota bacterium]
MKRLLLMLSSALILAAAGCGDAEPGPDSGGDPGVDAQEDLIYADEGGPDESTRDNAGKEDDGGTPDTSDALVPPDTAADTADVPEDLIPDVPGDVLTDVDDVGDAGDDATDTGSVDTFDSHVTPDTDDVAEDVADASDAVEDVGTDTTEPSFPAPVFVGYSAAAGQSVSQGYSLGFTMGLGRFEFEAAGGDYVLGPVMFVTE